ncbi:hypothetical protein JOF36_004653 [Pseudonocardia parietis]|uniref:Uncharacterized protein n=1 Tax=Pseudonocardia parietis TaxID=570936 RepID=A0ABS4VYF8_9PSEU|nr:hypothetical protein [Pseudonocardia parietis]
MMLPIVLASMFSVVLTWLPSCFELGSGQSRV